MKEIKLYVCALYIFVKSFSLFSWNIITSQNKENMFSVSLSAEAWAQVKKPGKIYTGMIENSAKSRI